ncbi:MAG: thioesterase family protein [Ginsengibacter sp.]
MARIKIDLPEKCRAICTIPVRITDVNYGNHVGNNSLVEIIHEARMQFLQQHNFTEMDAGGTSLILYKDFLTVRIFAGEISKVGFEIFYSISTIRNDIPVLIANAKTGMICFNYKQKKVEAVPGELKKILFD